MSAPEHLTEKSLAEMRAWIAGARPDDEVMVPVRLFSALVAEAERGREAKKSALGEVANG